MKKAILLLTVAMAVVLAGCGSGNKEIERVRAEQKRGLNQVREQVDVLSTQVRRLHEDVRELESDLFDIRARVDSGRGVGGVTARTTDSGDEIEVEPVAADSLEALAAEVTKVRADMARLRQEIIDERETAELRDPRKTWEAMNDPEKLTWRVDRFARMHGKAMKDEVTQQEFLVDVAAFKDQINERAGLTQEQLLEHYRTRITERVNTETNDRLRKWYEQQLRTLNTGQAKVVENQVKTFVRYDNVQGLKEIATKYNISNEELRDNGLQSYGGAYGWR